MIKYISDFSTAWNKLKERYPERLERITRFSLKGSDYSMKITLDGRTIIAVREENQKECYERITKRIWYYLKFH